MGKNSYLLPVMLVFFVLYFFFFPRTVKEEYLLIPEKKIDLHAEGEEAILSFQGDWAFASPRKMGYYDSATGAVQLLPGGGRARISDRFYMKETEGQLSLVSKTGELVTPLSTSLTPVLLDDHFFLTDLFQGYIREIDTLGRTIWEYTLPSLITCMDSQNGTTAVGLLSGQVFLFDSSGTPFYTGKPGGSRIDVVYGLALSEKADRLALVTGLDPQRFILIEKKENGFRPVYHENLSQSFRKEVSLSFDDSMNVVVEGVGEGLYFHWDDQSLSTFELPGTFSGSAASSEDGTLYFQSRRNEKTVLSVFTEDGEKVAENSYADSPYSMESRGDRILLSGENNVYIIRREFH
ncbi:MAG: hypothetical protein PQJ60_09565 [Spirochaetales bacterium]|nr:hypothetical protein [Spirochaetales bacterium]